MTRLMILLMVLATPGWGAWSVCKKLTVNNGQVSGGPHSNFKLLVSGTYSYLASTANGGVVTDAQGDDIRFYSTSDCATTALTYNRRSWSDTGAVEFWVRTTIDDGTIIYIGAGDAAVTTDGSDGATTWTEEYFAHHMGTSGTLTLTDAKGSYNLSDPSTGVTAGAGKISGAAVFDGGASTDRLNASAANSYTTMSQCLWFNATSNDSTARRLWSNGTSLLDQSFLYTTNGLELQAGWSGGNGAWYTSAPSTGAWHHFCVTYDGSSTANDPVFYVDGSSVSITENSTPSGTKLTDTNGALDIGNRPAGDRAWNGSIDNIIRIQGTIWGSGLIATMYNNQNAPDTFYTITDQAAATTVRRRIIVQ